MIRKIPAMPALEAFALYFESPQVWVEDERAKTEQLRRYETAWTRTGADEVVISFRRDGFVIFEFDRSPKFSGGAVSAHILDVGVPMSQEILAAENGRQNLVHQRIQYMNAFLLAMTSAVSTVHKMGSAVQQPVDPWNRLSAVCNAGKWDITTANTRYRLDFDVERPLVLQVEALEDAIGVMDACMREFGDQATLLLSLLYTASHQYRQHQYASAHMLGWCVTEALLNVIWKQLMSEAAIDEKAGTGHTAINKDRRKLLMGRDFTASVVSQMLSLSQKIDDDLLTRLDDARRVRNLFAHDLKPIAPEDSTKAIRLATDLLTRLCGRRVTSQLMTGGYY